ncbi:MAG: GNAT family N-acetyltransferase [Alphaproteobacteria bacterium]|nr:GNAT family N-acetyltransferase [Alphaproteobacteria bacterium]
MNVIEYFKSPNKERWKNEINKGDWSAAKLLFSLLDRGKLKELCGQSSEVYLLTDNDKLVSFAVLAEQDEIDAPELSPWIGFVYTFPAYRGHHCAGKLIGHICAVLKSEQKTRVYISTQETGLYEKYGFVFLKTMTNREGNPTKVYTKELRDQSPYSP